MIEQVETRTAAIFTKEQAALIVHCVNTWEILVEALRQSRKIIDDYYFGELCDDDVASELIKIDAVLSLADNNKQEK